LRLRLGWRNRRPGCLRGGTGGRVVCHFRGPDMGATPRAMIDNQHCQHAENCSYAVLSFGGFLGIGDDHYPLPWQSLKYDTNLGG
jgi:hypothetical protein